MPKTRIRSRRVDEVPSYDRKTGLIHAVVETTRGARAKVAFDPQSGTLLLKRVLPEGLSFPFDFGFVPSTLEEDGDPIDVLVLLDAQVPPLCVVPSRLIGVIEAKESGDDGSLVENNRLVAIGEQCQLFADVERVADLPSRVLEQIEQFFISYNQQDGKQFKVIACRGPRAAKRLLKDAQRRARRQR